MVSGKGPTKSHAARVACRREGMDAERLWRQLGGGVVKGGGRRARRGFHGGGGLGKMRHDGLAMESVELAFRGGGDRRDKQTKTAGATFMRRAGGVVNRRKEGQKARGCKRHTIANCPRRNGSDRRLTGCGLFYKKT